MEPRIYLRDFDKITYEKRPTGREDTIVVATTDRSRSGSLDGSRWQNRPDSRSQGRRRSDSFRTGPTKPRRKRHEWVIIHHQGNLITKRRKKSPGVGYLFARAAKRRFNGGIKSSLSNEPDDNVPGSKTSESEGDRLEVSFAELQRMRLRKLQFILVNHVADMFLGQGEPDGWEAILEQYIQAFRDYEYMTQALSAGAEDPFVANTEDEAVHWMLDEIHKNRGQEWPGDSPISLEEWKRICKKQEAIFDDTPSGKSVQPIGGTRRVNVRKSRLRSIQGRIMTAVVGGLFLIGPMWLMVLHNTRYTALISTSVCVFVFGVLMACSLEKPMEVLTSTAAYAAVLVVFVGANTQTDASAK